MRNDNTSNNLTHTTKTAIFYILNKFESISKYHCKDKEKLAVLEAKFYRKFAGVKTCNSIF